jgi:hypothetical protein
MTATISICDVICFAQQLVALKYAGVLDIPAVESNLTINYVYFSV